jgi:alpha-1,2-mannosyltransferase
MSYRDDREAEPPRRALNRATDSRSLRRRELRYEERRRGDALVLVLFAACVSGVFALFRAQPDFNVFYAAGRAVLRGVDPYPPPTSAWVYSQHAFVYPFWVSSVLAPLAWLPYAMARIVFLAVGFCACIVAARATARWGRVESAYALAVVLLAAPMVRSLQVGALNPELLLLVALAWRYRERQRLAGAFLGLAVALKLFLLPILVWPIIASRTRSAIIGALTAAALIAAGFAVGPLSAHAYLSLLKALTDHEGPGSSSLAGRLAQAGVAWPDAQAYAAAAAAFCLGVGGYAARRAHDERIALATALAAALLASPIVWSHYFLLALFPFLLLSLSWPRASAIIAASWLLFPPAF